MDIVHIYATERQADEGIRQFLSENYDKCERFLLTTFKKTVKIGEDTHWFMGENNYFRWCKGRTYIDENGVKYRSGYVLKQDN